MVVGDRLGVPEGNGRCELCRVDGAAAADADDGVGPGLTGKARGLYHAGKLRVLLHPAEDGGNAAVLFLHGLGRGGEVPPAGDDAALYAALVEYRCELCERALAEIDLDRLGIDELKRHRCSPRSR